MVLISSIAMPGRNSDAPRPKPLAPAAAQAAMPSGVMPPTASTGMSRGNTARKALITAGDPASAGKNLRPWAPAAMAAKASLGVKKPGSDAFLMRLREFRGKLPVDFKFNRDEANARS